MSKLITKTRNEIKEAWENKATQQAEVLTWPDDFPWTETQKRDFLRIVQPLRPIERMVKVNDKDPDKNLNIGYRENYRQYVWDELPNLAKLAGAAWVISSDDKGGVEGNAVDKQATTIVSWSPESQKTIFQKHFQWPSGTPSTLEILYAQEDLWVLRHLMQIIARTNEGATTRHSAAIRKILNIKIGKQAVYSDVTVETIGGEGDGSSRRASSESAASDDPNAIPDPAEGRYVDKNYEPLPAATLRQVMENEGELAPEQAYLAVAKRVPVRMRVSMDQRHIDKLLVECANSELTVEVRQLLINPDYVPSRASQPGGGGFGDLGFGGPPRAAGAREDTSSQFPFDLEVEIYGIVSIYNPVDDAALGIEPDQAVTDEDTAAVVAGTLTR
jgi:hypothetical protein